MNEARPHSAPNLRWPGLPKWLMLGVYLVAAAMIAGGLAGNRETREGGWMMIGAAPFALLISWIVAFVWLYRAWDAIPPAMRIGANGKEIAPANAVALLFVPILNVVWIFVANVGLARAALRWRTSAGLAIDRAAETCAWIACGVQSATFFAFVIGIFVPHDDGIPITIAHVVFFGGLGLAPLAWFAFMFAIDRALAPLRDR